MSTINEALHELNKKVSIKEANGEELDGMEECYAKSKKPVIKESIRTSAGDNFDSMIQEFKDGVMDLAQLGVDIHNEGLAQGLDITDIEEALMDATEEDGFLKVYQTIARDIEL